jgi:hypothetical protein
MIKKYKGNLLQNSTLQFYFLIKVKAILYFYQKYFIQKQFQLVIIEL